MFCLDRQGPVFSGSNMAENEVCWVSSPIGLSDPRENPHTDELRKHGGTRCAAVHEQHGPIAFGASPLPGNCHVDAEAVGKLRLNLDERQQAQVVA
jgi:hypothetical protein